MHDNQQQGSWMWGRMRTTLGALTVLCVVAGLGCSGEHRVSLDEFLEMQAEAAEVQVEVAAQETPEEREAVLAAMEDRMGPYRVGPSDVLLVTVTSVGEVGLFQPAQFRVDRNGEIDLPVVGAINVADMELEDVEDAILKSYVPSVVKDLAVHVQLADIDTTNVLVNGAVTLPGFIPLRRTERDLLHAIVGAGGISQGASGKVCLSRIRDADGDVTLDLSSPAGVRQALAMAPLQHGDIITVETAAPNTVFVGGLVNAPHPQYYPAGVDMNVLQVLAAASGLRTDVTPREATLTRRMANGTDVQVKLDLDRISTGEDPNIMLAAGDILWVPDTLETRVQDFINRNVFIRAGVSANVGYNVTGVEYMNRQSQQGQRFSNSSSGYSLQDMYDPFGFLTRNAVLNTLGTQSP